MSVIIIFTDGAAKHNPGPGGWGAIVASGTEVREIGGGEAHTTNNRMELTAALEALSHAKKYREEQIELYADSEYVVKGATLWGSGWRKNGWLTKQKKEALNRDIWEPLLELVDSFDGRISWHVVGGHVGVPGNERVDRIADAFARGDVPDLYQGSRDAYLVDVTDLSPQVEAKQKRARTRASGGAYSYVSMVDGKIELHATWVECKARVSGKMARFKKALSQEDEAAIIIAFQKKDS